MFAQQSLQRELSWGNSVCALEALQIAQSRNQLSVSNRWCMVSGSGLHRIVPEIAKLHCIFLFWSEVQDLRSKGLQKGDRHPAYALRSTHLYHLMWLSSALMYNDKHSLWQQAEWGSHGVYWAEDCWTYVWRAATSFLGSGWMDRTAEPGSLCHGALVDSRLLFRHCTVSTAVIFFLYTSGRKIS